MFAEWIPIAKMTTYETFKDADTHQSVVGNVFIGVALMVSAAMLTLLFYWAYQKEKHLFFAIFAGIVFLYTVKVIILVATLREKINMNIFRLYIGSTAFMSFMSLLLMIYFAVKASQRLKSSSSSSSSSSYALPSIARPMDEVV
jgi:drug/metabolite transporter (DMT)-like permease